MRSKHDIAELYAALSAMVKETYGVALDHSVLTTQLKERRDALIKELVSKATAHLPLDEIILSIEVLDGQKTETAGNILSAGPIPRSDPAQEADALREERIPDQVRTSDSSTGPRSTDGGKTAGRVQVRRGKSPVPQRSSN